MKFEFRPYRRPFRQPLQTNHGLWSVREGIILRLTDAAGQVGWGEIAPIAWFGSESLDQAIAFCHQLPTTITTETIAAIPDTLPACQFGFESALESLTLGQSGPPLSIALDRYSVLLPSGKAALHAWNPFYEKGYRTFKWKINSQDFGANLRLLLALRQALPSACALRLDANGGLSNRQAEQLLAICDAIGIEFVEQPLAPDRLSTMQHLTQQYATPLALDESVATLAQLQACYAQGWSGIVVIKPAIAGSPARLRQFCQSHAIDAVFSSSLGTAIGRQAGLRLALALGNPKRALGYGTTHWFDELETADFEHLWQTL